MSGTAPSTPPLDPALRRLLALLTTAQLREVPRACTECRAALDAFRAYHTADRPPLNELTGECHRTALDESMTVRQRLAAALGLLEELVGKVDLLTPLAWVLEHGPDPAWRRFLPDVAVQAQTALDTIRDAAATILAGAPPPQLDRLTFDDDTLTVTLDGTRYKVDNPKAYEVYKVIVRRDDNSPITKPKIRAKVKQVAGQKTIPNLLDTLPPALRRTVRVDTRGYWRELPEIP
jgi:hypothetical protein